MSSEFLKILEKSNHEKILPYLKSLDNDDKRKLVPEVKSLIKEYFEYKEVNTGPNTSTYKYKANEIQTSILICAAFVCFKQAEYEKLYFGSWILDKKYLDSVFLWYCPSWFSDYVNNLAKQEYFYHQMDYDLLLKLKDMGYLNPSPILIVKLLPQYIFDNVQRTWKYNPEKLLEHPDTLNEHIWYLFENESNLHYSDRYLNFENEASKEKIGWIALFKEFSSNNKVSRQRLLREALLASNRNFNKVLSGWFVDLFNQLQPTSQEIISLQNELISCLSSPHSKPVNSALQYFKRIIADQDFNKTAFLENTPVLLNSDTKNIVTGTLIILDKLARANETMRVKICIAATNTFIHADDDLQTRAAKIIDTYGQDLTDESLEAELQFYSETMMSGARSLIQKRTNISLWGEKINRIDSPSNDILDKNLTALQIPYTESFNDLIFLSSQAFDNNHSWHIDLLPASLLKWQFELKGENLVQLEPALQRALKLTNNDMRSDQGTLDHMLAIFFIDICIHLYRKFPMDTERFADIFDKFDKQDKNGTQRWLAIKPDKEYLTGWDNYHHDPVYLPHKQLLLEALYKFKQNDILPLLSTPTHEPGWLSAETLVTRLAEYQSKSKMPAETDFQIAVSRCKSLGKNSAIEKAEALLTGEIKNLMLFLLGKQSDPRAPFFNLSIWMCASVSLPVKRILPEFSHFSYYNNPFATYSGQYPWQTYIKEYETEIYDYTIKKSVKVKQKRKSLEILKKKTEGKEQSFIGKLLSKVLTNVKSEIILYDNFHFNTRYISHEHNDIQRMLLLTPNNPEPLLAGIISLCLEETTFSDEGSKRMVIKSLQTMYDIWETPGEMAHLLLATCMLASDKVVSSLAAEIWLNKINKDQINNFRLGQIIGIHQKIELAPLKRLTDLMSQQMFRVSKTHDYHLLILIENILVELPDTPIKNLKKLLELLVELVSLNGSKISNPIILDKFNTWNSNNSLSTVIKKLK